MDDAAMEAVRLLTLLSTHSPSLGSPRRRYESSLSFTSCPVRAFCSSLPPTTSTGFKARKPRRNPVADWVSGNDAAARSIPIFTGGISLVGILLNRAFSGIAPVADASSLFCIRRGGSDPQPRPGPDEGPTFKVPWSNNALNGNRSSKRKKSTG